MLARLVRHSRRLEAVHEELHQEFPRFATLVLLGGLVLGAPLEELGADKRAEVAGKTPRHDLANETPRPTGEVGVVVLLQELDRGEPLEQRDVPTELLVVLQKAEEGLGIDEAQVGPVLPVVPAGLDGAEDDPVGGVLGTGIADGAVAARAVVAREKRQGRITHLRRPIRDRGHGIAEQTHHHPAADTSGLVTHGAQLLPRRAVDLSHRHDEQELQIRCPHTEQVGQGLPRSLVLDESPEIQLLLHVTSYAPDYIRTRKSRSSPQAEQENITKKQQIVNMAYWYKLFYIQHSQQIKKYAKIYLL